MERGGVMESISFRILQSEGSGEDMGVLVFLFEMISSVLDPCRCRLWYGM